MKNLQNCKLYDFNTGIKDIY